MDKKWKSLRDFFEDLNGHCVYVILRNWDSLKDESPYMSGHEDIDLLCSSLEAFMKYTKAKPIHNLSSRNNYLISIGEKQVRFDVRYIGDGYYDEKWERDMLESRKLEDAFYVLSDKQLSYSLAYHALVQKPQLSKEYKKIVSALLNVKDEKESTILDIVKNYCIQNKYVATIPHDPGVFFNRKNAKAIGINSDYCLCQ